MDTRNNDKSEHESEQDSDPEIEPMFTNLKHLECKDLDSNLLDKIKGKTDKGTDFEDTWLNTEVDRNFVAELKTLMKRDEQIVKEERESEESPRLLLFENEKRGGKKKKKAGFDRVGLSCILIRYFVAVDRIVIWIIAGVAYPWTCWAVVVSGLKSSYSEGRKLLKM